MLGCPWRIDFSGAEPLLIDSSGKATSTGFLRGIIIERPFERRDMRQTCVFASRVGAEESTGYDHASSARMRFYAF